MKIVAIIGNPSPPLIYFVNKINSIHKIDLLIIEDKTEKQVVIKPGAKKKVQKSFIEKLLGYALYKLENRKQSLKHKTAQLEFVTFCKKWFGNLYERIDPSIPFLKTVNINSVEVQDKIKEIKPELILDHGSSLLKSETFSLANLALNIHWGLSPYYRGVNCSSHALMNWDINNIGVTVHKLANEIDGGEILGQARLNIKTLEDVRSIPHQLTYHGTEIMICAINALNSNQTLTFHNQDYDKGFLFKSIHWSMNMASFVSAIDEALLLKMLRKPSRKKVSIVEFRAN